MKKTIITFKAIRNGRVVHKNIPIYHDFNVLPPEEFQGVLLPPTSVESQVIDQLDQMDKTEFMLEHDFDIILDYYPKKKRVRRNEIDEFVKFCEPYLKIYPQFRMPFQSVVSESKDILFGKGKSNEQKFKETVNLVTVSLKAAKGTIILIDNILAQLDESIKRIEN